MKPITKTTKPEKNDPVTFVDPNFKRMPDDFVEIWRTIKKFDNYSISNAGRVRSNITGRLKSQRVWINNAGNPALQVDLALNNEDHTKLVHRLVAEAFIPNPEEYFFVTFKNKGEFDNCSVDNLQWSSRAHNNFRGGRPKLKR